MGDCFFSQKIHALQHVFLLLCAETGGILLSPRPAPDDSPLKPEFPARPFFGVEPVILDDKVTLNSLFLLLCMFLVVITCILYWSASMSPGGGSSLIKRTVRGACRLFGLKNQF